MDLFKLVGSIFIDNEKANESLQKTDDTAQKTGTTLKNVASGAAKTAGAIVAGSAAAVSGIVALTNSAAQEADTIDKASIRMGISAERYQELSFVAERSGVSMEQMEAAAKKLEGTGVNFDDAIAQIMSMETAEERAAAAADLFGEKVAYNLSPLIEQSSEDFYALTDRAHELGLVLSDEDVKAGVLLGDTMSDITKSFKMIVTQLGAKLMPLVQQMAEQIIKYIPTIMQMFDRLAPILASLFDNLMPPLLDLTEEVFPLLMEIIETLLPPIIEIVNILLPLIVDLLKTFLPLIRPILDLLVAILPVVMDLINFTLKPIIELITIINNLIMTGLGAAISWIADKFGWFYGIFRDGILKAFDWIKGIWEKVKAFLPKIGEIFKGVWDNVKAIFKAGLNSIIWVLNKAIDGINILLVPLRAVITAVGKMFGASWSMGDVKIPKIPELANGGTATGEGAALVGEDGPEVLNVPRGASVIPLNEQALPGLDVLGEKMDAILAMLQAFFATKPDYGVYIDGSALVGVLAPGMDQELGRIASRKGRNV